MYNNYSINYVAFVNGKLVKSGMLSDGYRYQEDAEYDYELYRMRAEYMSVLALPDTCVVQLNIEDLRAPEEKCDCYYTCECDGLCSECKAELEYQKSCEKELGV